MTEYPGSHFPSSDFPQQPALPPPRSRRLVVVGVITGLIVVNSIGYLAYRSIKQSGDPELATAVPREEGAGQTGREGSASSDDAAGTEGLIKAYRAIGLQAFEDADYDLAVEKLGKAVELGGGGDIPQLLVIAEEMQERKASEGKAPVTAKPVEVATAQTGKTGGEAGSDQAEPAAEDDRGKGKGDDEAARPAAKPADSNNNGRKRKRAWRPSRKRVATAAKKPTSEPDDEPGDDDEDEAAEPEEDKPGIILVTSTPAKLVVSVDGKRVDLTPAKLTMTPGTYRVTMSRHDQVLHSRTVTLESGQVVSVNQDLSEKVIEQDQRIAALTTRKAPDPAPPKTTPVERKPPEPRPQPSKFGEVYILSPNVYGEVYVDGKARGFPPVVVKKVPVGKVRVEIRVQGKTRRAKAIRVTEGERTQVRFR